MTRMESEHRFALRGSAIDGRNGVQYTSNASLKKCPNRDASQGLDDGHPLEIRRGSSRSDPRVARHSRSKPDSSAVTLGRSNDFA